MASNKSIEEINKKIETGKVKVMTAQELCDAVRNDEKISVNDVDVVTTATRGLMSGTLAILSFKVAEKNVFMRASRITLNDVPATPGPAPDEYLGFVDCIIHGTAKRSEKYGGGHLFRDLVERKHIDVRVESVDGKEIETKLTLDDIPYAMLFSTRAVCNYMIFVNPSDKPFNTIFAVKPLGRNFTEATFCGCGEINPLRKDPHMRTIGIGTKILMNASVGYVIGRGTLSSPGRPNLAGIADMHFMNPEYMGGFITSAGPEVINSWAVPIPILDEKILDTAKTLDTQLDIPIVDVHGRIHLANAKFADVWKGKSFRVGYKREICDLSKHDCACIVEDSCPTCAFTLENGINEKLCFNCGVCVIHCPGKAFSTDLGSISYQHKNIPIVLRQSDRVKALKLAKLLKTKIEKGDFFIAEPIDKIVL
jgi:putative methanogenesis marker 16 metalloprotein